MKKKRIIIIAAAIIVVAAIIATVLFSCKGDDLTAGDDLTSKVSAAEDATYNFKSGETETPNSYTAYKDSAVSFSLDTLRALYKDNKNAFFSPAALYGQLCLFENAAAGKSRAQISKVANKGLALEELNSSSGYFFSRLEELSGAASDASIDIKNNIFFNENITVSQNFIRQNAGFYSQGLFRLNYGEPKTLDRINRYVGSESGGQANALLPELDAAKGINLTETVNFSDKWLAGYDSVSEGSFNGKAASFLNSREFYLSAKGCQGFIKDYQNTPCKFVAILPDGDLDKFIEKLDSSVYQSLIDSMNVMKTCDASLPTFKTEFEGDLSPVLKANGVEDIFTAASNLNGLSYNCKAKADRFMQSAKFRVTASGTDDGDAVISDNTKPESENKVKLDRPFIYMVVDNESYIPLLMGVVTDYEAIS